MTDTTVANKFVRKEREHLEVLRKRLDHIRDDRPERSDDPAYPPGEANALGLRVVAAVESGEFPSGANAAADAPRGLFPGLSAKLTRRAEA